TRIAPPSPAMPSSPQMLSVVFALPLRITNPSSVTLDAAVRNTRSLAPPSIVVAAGPGCCLAPTIVVVGLLIVSEPKVRLYTPAGTLIVPPPLLSAFAAATAARSVHFDAVQLPVASAVVVTLKVVTVVAVAVATCSIEVRSTNAMPATTRRIQRFDSVIRFAPIRRRRTQPPARAERNRSAERMPPEGQDYSVTATQREKAVIY